MGANVTASPTLDHRKSSLSLKARLGLGALILGAGALLTALILFLGLQQVAARLDTALAAENRMSRYATLSSQATTFLVVATENIQTGQKSDIRIDRLSPVVDQLRTTFKALHVDVASAVTAAQDLGIDAQSRYGTQSLGLARMEAILGNTLTGLATETDNKDQLRAYIDTFASNIDPLLSQAVNTELLFRNTILKGIDELRQTLSIAALSIAGLTLLLTAGFYFGLVRPQFNRLDRLRDAAHRIGQADFAVALPDTRQDEIGRLYSETNRMASALSTREQEVQTEWSRLNDTVAARTEELRDANAKLSEIDGNRRRFFADVSHELRTPLTVILMEAQIGQKGGAGSTEAFATIENRAARLNRRIDDLLRVARSDSGQLALEKRETQLTDLLSAVQSETTSELETAGLTFTTLEIPNATLNCDPNWIRQVLVSLLRNTIRHASGGGHVALGATLTQTSANIFVLDNGPGIATEDQTRIFDRFAQASSEKSQGFGVGFALVRWVIEEHSGTISVTSPVPQDEALGSDAGTKITVSLPVLTPS